jgi:hypothetical protein
LVADQLEERDLLQRLIENMWARLTWIYHIVMVMQKCSFLSRRKSK